MSTFTVKAYGAESKTADLKEMNIERREITSKDVEIEILYCGYATLIFIRQETTGAEPSTLLFPDMRL